MRPSWTPDERIAVTLDMNAEPIVCKVLDAYHITPLDVDYHCVDVMLEPLNPTAHGITEIQITHRSDSRDIALVRRADDPTQDYTASLVDDYHRPEPDQ